MGELLLCPSVYYVDFTRLGPEIAALDEAGANIFHIDVMDGEFIENFALGPLDLQAVRRSTGKLVDVHLMVARPGRYISLFAGCGADIVYIHPESDPDPAQTLHRIRALGKAPGIAVDPAVSVSALTALLPLCDYVLAMGVRPGFAGQRFLEAVVPKILLLAGLKDQYGYKLVVDGGVTARIVARLRPRGVDGFVLGNLILFGQEKSYRETMATLNHS